jgi:hypothetical protein
LVTLTAGTWGCGSNPDPSTDAEVDAYLQFLTDARSKRIVRLEKRLRRERREPEAVAPMAPTGDSNGRGEDLDVLGDQLGAQVGATVGPPGSQPLVAGSLQSGSAWSTIKVPIAMAVAAQNGGFSSTDQSLVSSAITLSDNEAAAQLFGELGSLEAASDKVTAVLRSAGDEQTVVSTQGRGSFSTYGQTDWSLQAQHRFVSSLLLGCFGDPASRGYVIDQMRNVTSDTWGLGSAGMPALWKGGWGPGVDGRYLLRQMGAIEVDGRQYVATLAVIPDNGDFATGQQIASEVARWIVAHAPATSGGGGGC